LAETLATELEASVTGTPDRWLRAEFPPEWPIVDALNALSAQVSGLRIGVLDPFEKPLIAKVRCPTSSSAQQITGWRNEPIAKRRTKPTIILGDARGREEAGLLTAPRVLTDVTVLRRFAKSVEDWLRSNVHSETPQLLFRWLFDLAVSATIDAVKLDEYIAVALRDPDKLLTVIRSELWRLNLIPDQRILDTGEASSRLQRNIETRQLLTAAADSPGDLKRIERLKEAAKAGCDIAKRALQYRDDSDRIHLRGVELEQLIGILFPQSPPPPPSPRPLTLLDLFDQSDAASRDLVKQTLDVLASNWDLDHTEPFELQATFAPPSRAPREVCIEVVPDPREGLFWVGDGSAAGQQLGVIQDARGSRDWLPLPPEGRTLSGEWLLDRARAQDTIAKQSIFETLVNQFLAARANLSSYERWLRQSGFELLLLWSAARDAVRDYLDAWQALADTATKVSAEDAGLIRPALLCLEAVWGKSSQDVYEWCVLGPFHPFVLDPWLSLANYALTSLGKRELGEKIGWARDRSVPAYRAIWSTTGTLFLSHEADVFTFEAAPAGRRPLATSGDGLSQIAQAFMGFHPFSQEALVITLIDPPKGGALASNLRRLRSLVKDMRVYLVTTSPASAQLEEAGELVRNLGRFDSLSEWLDRAPVKSHLLFFFAEGSPGAAMAAQGFLGPTPGAHVALKIGLDAPPVLEPSDRLIPYVTFEPRENNGPVVAIQNLARPALGAPRLFEVKPSLSEEAANVLVRAGSVAEWVIIGAPAPLGLIAPKRVGEGLTYLGRESLGSYGLFAYATSLFSVTKCVTEGLRSMPVIPNPGEIEARLTALAVDTTNGVLRIGRTSGQAIYEQIGLMISSAIGRGVGL
jgi:hypothetical protein